MAHASCRACGHYLAMHCEYGCLECKCHLTFDRLTEDR